ncbi:MarR family transcriptional regulator [Phycicoccus sp. MAQZ13P-2]|uniref:MarR family winged helix-turn-helix transcriptional regulator n=1 Tax=Phycicoccus mangrovi TaxID=2840470 RepID=UPI001C000C85|nr:MarR family transcriptional regulator [Phycicoccus mangrovi]MBT9254620.1 MarR family transcriptional regulator [Phycicoccus mangrovi]MBT9273175.1 MarR family transcriptional regulator [Phycicoccus mangrovi]
MGRTPSLEGETEAVEAMMRAARMFNAFLAASLARTGGRVTPTQLRVLVFIADHPEAGTADVAETLGTDPSSATRLCDRLAVAKLIARRQATSDRRRVRLSLTPEGRRLVQSVMDHRREVFAGLVDTLSPDDRAVLVQALDALVATTDVVPSVQRDPR